ncbi:DNA sulfur modification protein DndB [Scopulibacillus cellulosilyticus]|uniref:DNA sulfur modification protein DndB n=1 Tax=Scopulibacillus cellulosilyticus TaxID=2665665 RepID=A0ABW2PXN3_9BACL
MTNTIGLVTQMQGQIYRQFGKKILMTSMPFRQLEAIFDIDYNVQRELDIGKLNEIRQYILDHPDDEGFYYSPFIFSARGAIVENDNGEWVIDPTKKIYVQDGQHRLSAHASAVNRLKSKNETLAERGKFNDLEYIQSKEQIDKLLNFPIMMQIYLNLNTEEERQLFTDINTSRKDAHQGLVMRYDQRDPYTVMTRKVAKKLENRIEIEWQLSRLTTKNTALTSLRIIKRCLLALFEGTLTVKNGEPYPRRCRIEEMPDVAETFFNTLVDVFPSKAWDRKKYTSGLTGIQVALAYTVFKYAEQNDCDYYGAIKNLMVLKKCCTWRHDDPLYSNFYDSTARKIKRHSETIAIQKLSKIFLECINK